MSLTSIYKTNEALETDGVWQTMGQTDDGREIRFKLSRMSKSNTRYKKTLEKATRPHRAAIRLDTLNEKVAESVMLGVFVDSILLGWENVPLSDVTGNAEDTGDAPFTRENAIKLLERLPDLYDDAQERAGKLSTYRDETLEVAGKN